MGTATRIELTPRGLRLGHGLLAARRVRGEDPDDVRVALVATQALLLAGDHVRIEVSVEGPLGLTVIEPAGTVAYDMQGGSARWDVEIVLRGGARLTWHGEPLVVAAGADATRSTVVDLDAGSTATLRETVVLGRSGEDGGALRQRTHVSRAGTPLLVEDLDLSPAVRRGPATIGAHRVVDSLTTLGHRLPDEPGTLQLDGPGSVLRWLGADLHRTSVVP